MTSTPPPEPISPSRSENASPAPPPTEPYHSPEIPYSEGFENSIMNTILNPHGAFAPPSYAPKSDEPPPTISKEELPLPLHDFRRIYPSPIPGVLLSHPSHTIHGAPGPSEEQLIQLAQDLVQKHGIRNEAQFLHWLDAEEAQQKRDLKERMRRRQIAIRENEVVHQELARLDDERDVERRVAERLRTKNRSSGGGEEKEEESESSDSDIGAVMA